MKALFLIGLLVCLVVFAWWIERDDSTTPPTTVEESVVTDEPVLVAEPAPSNAAGTVEVYDGISVPRNTRILDLSGRNLSGSLKAEVRHLTELEVLDISNNSFTGLPAEVGQLSNLQILNLSKNPLTGLPLELGNLQNLEQLDLLGTQYSEQDLAIIRQSLPESTVIFTN